MGCQCLITGDEGRWGQGRLIDRLPRARWALAMTGWELICELFCGLANSLEVGLHVTVGHAVEIEDGAV